jgi:hypothetical protein
MIARLLYAAVALCLLGAWPEHAGTRAAPSVAAAAPGPASFASGAPSGVSPTRADFAIPRNSR